MFYIIVYIVNTGAHPVFELFRRGELFFISNAVMIKEHHQ